jgi:murein DD-endopeptidase MepM/ murein hydrolase activator NlpD
VRLATTPKNFEAQAARDRRALLQPLIVYGLRDSGVNPFTNAAETGAMPPLVRILTALMTTLAPAAAAQGPDLRAAAAASESQFEFLTCPMAIANAPLTDDKRRIVGIRRTVAVGGVRLMIAPATRACLSSGYGARNGRRHAGVDYYAPDGDAIAAGVGVVREATVRSDYGAMLLIEHADRVFTRYAHLAAFSRDFVPGDTVAAGDILGPVGMTGEARAPHLHYEVLVGDYAGDRGSFGLTALDPIGLARAESAEAARAAASLALSAP